MSDEKDTQPKKTRARLAAAEPETAAAQVQPVEQAQEEQEAQQAEAPALPAPAPTERPIGIAEFTEENPRLTREARDILRRLHGYDRKPRAEWKKLAEEYGGSR